MVSERFQNAKLAVGRVILDQNDWALWHQTRFELKVVATSPANSFQRLVGALKTV